MKPVGWDIDNGMGAVRKWDLQVRWKGSRGSRDTHRTDKRMRAREKRQVRREVQDA